MTGDTSRASATDVQDIALDVLAEWLGGYFTLDDGTQLRFHAGAIDGDTLMVSVEECDPYPGNRRYFAIRVTAEEEVPASWPASS